MILSYLRFYLRIWNKYRTANSIIPPDSNILNKIQIYTAWENLITV